MTGHNIRSYLAGGDWCGLLLIKWEETAIRLQNHMPNDFLVSHCTVDVCMVVEA